MNLKPALVLLLIHFSCISASAQVSVGVNTGAVFPVGELKQYLSTTYGPGVDILYNFNSHFSVGAGGSYYRVEANYDDIAGTYILAPLSLSGYYHFSGKRWKPFIAAGASAFWTEIHATLERNVKIDTEDFFFGFNIKLGTVYKFSKKWSTKVYIDGSTFFLRDTHNVKFFKDAITDKDLRDAVFPKYTPFASLNLGVYYTLSR